MEIDFFLKLWGPRRYFSIDQFGEEPYFSVLPELMATAPTEFRTASIIYIGSGRPSVIYPSSIANACSWLGEGPPRGSFDLADEGCKVILEARDILRCVRYTPSPPSYGPFFKDPRPVFSEECSFVCVMARESDLANVKDRSDYVSGRKILLLSADHANKKEEDHFKAEFAKIAELIPIQYTARKLTPPLADLPKMSGMRLTMSDVSIREAQLLWKWLEPRLNFPGLRTREDIPLRFIQP